MPSLLAIDWIARTGDLGRRVSAMAVPDGVNGHPPQAAIIPCVLA